MDKYKIFAVVPTFNRKDLLEKCINSLIEQNIPLSQIVIVNSGSTDSTNSMLKKFAKKIHIINGNSSWWWAKSMNEGIKYSLKKGADYILAMNDDTYLGIDALKHLLETSIKTKKAIVGSVVTNANNIDDFYNSRYGAKYTMFKWLSTKLILTKINGREIYYTEGQSGRGVLFPKEIFEKVGLYDEIRFPQYADRDFSLRCIKENVIQCIDSSSLVYLNFETTQIGINESKMSINNIKNILFDIKGVYNIKNQYRFLRKHYKKFWFFWFFLWLGSVFFRIIIHVIPGGMQLIKNFKNTNSYAKD